jgi:hypothetical protein
VYEPETGQWGDLGGQLFDDDGTGHRTPAPGHHSGPWDHEIQGMYRARELPARKGAGGDSPLNA